MNKKLHPLTDDIAALFLIISGVIGVYFGYPEGYGFAASGAGYIFGKNKPLR